MLWPSLLIRFLSMAALVFGAPLSSGVPLLVLASDRIALGTVTSSGVAPSRTARLNRSPDFRLRQNRPRLCSVFIAASDRLVRSPLLSPFTGASDFFFSFLVDLSCLRVSSTRICLFRFFSVRFFDGLLLVSPSRRCFNNLQCTCHFSGPPFELCFTFLFSRVGGCSAYAFFLALRWLPLFSPSLPFPQFLSLRFFPGFRPSDPRAFLFATQKYGSSFREALFDLPLRPCFSFFFLIFFFVKLFVYYLDSSVCQDPRLSARRIF